MTHSTHPAVLQTPSRLMFTLLAFVLIAAFAPARLRAEEKPAPRPVAWKVEQLDEALYRISGSDAGGVVVLIGKKGLLLVDSEDVAHAAVFDSVLRSISALPVRYVINTHYHFDHLGGNARYRKAGAKIVAHENMWAQAVKDTVIADWGNWHREAADPGAEPQITFADTLRLRLDGDPVLLTHIPAAHTDGDLMAWFPKHDVLVAGDVIEIGAAPFVDLWAGGTVGGMINSIDRLHRAASDETRIVPGHGSIIQRADLREYRKMVSTIANLAAESIAEGRDLKAFLALEPARQFEDRLGSPRAARTMAALFFYGLNGMKE